VSVSYRSFSHKYPKNDFHGSQAESMPLPIRRSRVLPVHPIDVLRRCIQTGCPWMQISKGVPLALRQRDGPHIKTAAAGSAAVADP